MIALPIYCGAITDRCENFILSILLNWRYSNKIAPNIFVHSIQIYTLIAYRAWKFSNLLTFDAGFLTFNSTHLFFQDIDPKFSGVFSFNYTKALLSRTFRELSIDMLRYPRRSVDRNFKILGSSQKSRKISNYKKVKKWSKVFRKKTNFHPKSKRNWLITHLAEWKKWGTGSIKDTE